jgi:hypothetical protein
MAAAAALAVRRSQERFRNGQGTYSGTYIQRQYNRQLSQSRSGSSGAVAGVHHNPVEPDRPLPPLPSKICPGMEIRLCTLTDYSRRGGSSSTTTPDESPEECGICLAAFADGDPLRVPPCGHRFHASCLRQWFNASGPSCPTCRLVVKIPPVAPPRSGPELAMQMLGLPPASLSLNTFVVPIGASPSASSPSMAAARRPRPLERLRQALFAARANRGSSRSSAAAAVAAAGAPRLRGERRLDPFLDEYWGDFRSSTPILERYAHRGGSGGGSTL